MTVHPDTLERLKGELPGVRTLATLFGPPGNDESVTEAVDELRQNFPGVDDLTLAAFLAYNVNVGNMAGQDSLEMLAMAVSFAQMALVLAGDLHEAF